MSVYKNLVVCDLHQMLPQALAEIEEIKNVTLLILPEHPDIEFAKAYGAIKKKNIVATVFYPADALLTTFSGSTVLSAKLLEQDIHIVSTGRTIVEELPQKWNAKVNAVGQLIYPKGSGGIFDSVTGECLGLDYEHYVSISEEVTITPDFLNLLEKKTLVHCSEEISIAAEVTLEMLTEKMPYLWSDKKILCEKEVLPFVRLRGKEPSKMELAMMQEQSDVPKI
ncbi:MAG: hypothetical protein IJE98_07080 [Oscillospiraceae bacterium]|nr:hypothetical protein [Oscillospiraceae bacterium]